ncbi:MAG: DUF2281 domain-containing protein [Okeania sp. SIO3C4]|nr:DUF2281 domain-containing protein [Okeania sp. SIO3C4]
MNIEQTLLKNFRELPPEKQQEILDFSEFIRQKTLVKPEPKIPQQQAENWKNWAESQPPNSHCLPESALKRETIY